MPDPAHQPVAVARSLVAALVDGQRSPLAVLDEHALAARAVDRGERDLVAPRSRGGELDAERPARRLRRGEDRETIGAIAVHPLDVDGPLAGAFHQIAAELGYGPSAFSAMVRRTVGMAPGRFLGTQAGPRGG